MLLTEIVLATFYFNVGHGYLNSGILKGKKMFDIIIGHGKYTFFAFYILWPDELGPMWAVRLEILNKCLIDWTSKT